MYARLSPPALRVRVTPEVVLSLLAVFHEMRQPVLEGGWRSGRRRSARWPGVIARIGLAAGGGELSGVRPGRRFRIALLERQFEAALVVDAQHLDGDFVFLNQEIANVTHERIRDLGDVDKAALTSTESDNGAEVSDLDHGARNNTTSFDGHRIRRLPPICPSI
jgi:hypothetical protein